MSNLLNLALVIRRAAEENEARIESAVETMRGIAPDWQRLLHEFEPNEMTRFIETVEAAHKTLIEQMDMVCNRLQLAHDYLKANPDA